VNNTIFIFDNQNLLRHIWCSQDTQPQGTP
jgi:hypothetical protein